MKLNRIRISVAPTHVMVEKRSPWTPVATFFGTFLFCIAISPLAHGRNGPFLFQIMLNSDRPTKLAVLLFVAILSAFLSYGSLKLAQAEFVHFDAVKLHHGRKGLGVRWVRNSYSRDAVKRLRWDLFEIDRNTNVRALRFEANGFSEHALEGLTLTEADSILAACQKLGYDVFRDDSVPMLLDIEKNGWFVNPWKSDSPEASSKEQR